MTRLLTPEDFYALKLVEDVRISPDGSRIAYVQVEVDREAYEYRRSIWIMPVEGGEPLHFTTGAHDSSPRWSPDGRMLAFVRKPASGVKPKSAEERDKGIGSPQIWLIPLDGGEAQQLTFRRDGASGPVWSPDGGQIAFTAKTGEPDDPEVDEAALEGKTIPRVRAIDRVWYRADGQGFIYAQRSHIFSISVEGGEPRQLTDGDYDDGLPDWSPDSTHLVFVSDRSEERWIWPAPSVWMLEVASGKLTRLTDESLSCHSPRWSPDGKTIAFIAGPRRHSVGHSDLYVVPASTPGKQRILTQDFTPTCEDTCLDDLRAGHGALELTWSPDGKDIFFAGTMRGTVHVYAVRVAENLLPRRVTDGDCRTYSFSLDHNCHTLALGISDTVEPGDLYVQAVAAQGGKGEVTERRRLTQLNAELLAEVELARPEEFTFIGADGWELQGWVMRPTQVGAGEPADVPVVLEIHGGPMSMYGYSFFLEFQLLVAHGYAVVYSNPRGSTGYGRIFSGAVVNDWGGKDYQDILAGLDAAIARGGIDANRMGVAGGSYGGFMTNWAVSHSDRFRAAVTMRSVVDMESFFGTSDIGPRFTVSQLNAKPWEEAERLASFSPLTYVDRIQTPLLILHSDEDLRCPIEQAEQLFTALKFLGREVELVRFEGQNHDLSRSGHPRSRVIRLQKILGWFQRYNPIG
jgi:dipeptidyl aminopeptidase/acylaminoacyl peptidase